MNIIVSSQLEQHPDTIIVPVIGNGAHEATLDAIEKHYDLKASAALRQDFKAEHAEVHIVYTATQRLYLLGLGTKPSFTDVIRALRSLAYKYRQKLPTQIAVNLLHSNAGEALEQWVEAAVTGLLLGTYRIGLFKTTDTDLHPFQQSDASLTIVVDEAHVPAAQAAAAKATLVAETQMRIFDLVNAPSNKKVPTDLANWAADSGKRYNYRVETWSKEQIIATGLHALLAVNQGSNLPPSFIIMEYVPKGKPTCKVGLVGKGVTFDTGGLSIKPSANMHLMKSDMGGAAAVLGAMELVARLQPQVHVIGIIPATENSVDSRSVKPGDVIGSYSGKTIEVIDTDAEGRLILADALAYMVKHFNPDYLIDLATLTGSTVRTFGYHAAAIFSNNDALCEALIRTGERTGELLWRLPLWDAYKDDIKSDVADVRNFSGRPVGGAISAAKFLEAFIGEHPAWAHLDIAGVALTDSEFSSQKSATAYGVRLLLEFLFELEKSAN